MSIYLLEFGLAGSRDLYRWPTPAMPQQEAIEPASDLTAQGKGVVYRALPWDRL